MRAHRLAAWLVACAAASLAAPAGAGAATVTAAESEFTVGRGEQVRATSVAFSADAGEANDVTASLGGGQALLRDAGAPLRAGPGCEQVDEHTVRCPVLSVASASVLVGDGDDRVTATGLIGVAGGPGRDVLRSDGGPISGEEGDDELTGQSLTGGGGDDVLVLTERGQGAGGPGDDRITGSAGDDSLGGGSGRDVLHAGAGDDRLTDGDGAGGDIYGPYDSPTPVDADVLDGGPGRDEVDYGRREGRLFVDLSRDGPMGEPGENDAGSQLEVVAGGYGDDVLIASPRGGWLRGDRGDDVLVGSPAAERLQGDSGDDRLTGAGGGDQLAGGPGADRLAGGDGSDGLSGGGGADHLDGGAGHDGLDGGEAIDVVVGGPGADRVLAAGDFLRDRVSCGAGRDAVSADRGDATTASCERVRRVPFAPLFDIGTPAIDGPPTAVVTRGGRVLLTIDCNERLLDSCRGTATLKVAGAGLLRGRFACIPASERVEFPCGGGAVTVTGLRLGRRARAVLRRRGVLRATATAALSPGPGRGALVQRERFLLRPR